MKINYKKLGSEKAVLSGLTMEWNRKEQWCSTNPAAADHHIGAATNVVSLVVIMSVG